MDGMYGWQEVKIIGMYQQTKNRQTNKRSDGFIFVKRNTLLIYRKRDLLTFRVTTVDLGSAVKLKLPCRFPFHGRGL